MHAVVGPVITRKGGYAFDSWTPNAGLSRGFSYPRVEDAHYARNVEIRSFRRGLAGGLVACSTVDEFAAELAEQEIEGAVLLSI
jgi:hypothetical protein